VKIAIRYYTRSKKGNTLKLANVVSEVAKVEALTIENDLQEETEILFLVNAMYAFDVDNQVKDFLKRNASKIKCLVNVNSAASGASTLKSVKKVADKLNIPVSDKEYHTVASWLALNRNRPNEDDLNRLKQFVEGVIKQ